MKDFRHKWAHDYIDLIEKHYSVLTDRERNSLMLYKNLVNKNIHNMGTDIFNKLKELAESVRVKY